MLRGGLVEQVGSPSELYDHPGNLFVAGFIGSPRMTFLPARVTQASDGGISVNCANFANPETVTFASHAALNWGFARKTLTRPHHTSPSRQSQVMSAVVSTSTETGSTNSE